MEADERLSELFGRAIALAAPGRAALLAEVRGEDPALADSLAALLEVGAARLDAGAETALAQGGTAVDAGGDTALAGGAAEAGAAVDAVGATAAITPATPPAAHVRPPRRRPDIPGFRLLQVIGEGAMGTVYAGEQDAPRRPVAIKVLHATSPSALARFLTEAEIMARLDHPGIAKVLEAGQADGHPYFVMERVDGVTLDAHVRGTELPRARRLALFVGLCDAIHHAHVKGVIHRDLKPSNVMVRADGRVAVLDFGIARLADVDGSSSGETRAGELIGTPVYMSPEQARLRPDEVDARSDVYTLGVILYELCAGELPYDVRGKALPDVARAICHDPPRPLGRRGPGLRGDLEAICDKALAKDPEGRYQSAAALADDVRAHLDGGTVSARVPGAIEQLRRLARRRPGVAAAIAAAVVGGALFAAVITALWLEARDARRVADRERARLAAANDLLERRTNELVLDQARAALARDPTAARAALATLTDRGVDPGEAWAIADEALGRGVARAVLRGHTDEVRWIERVPGRDAVVTGGYDGLALRWDAGVEAPVVLWRAAGRVHVVRPSPDGTRLAIGADGGGVRVVDVDGALIGEAIGLRGDVGVIAWSADGGWLAAGDSEGGVWLWPRDGGAGRRLAGPAAEIEAVMFEPGGSALVAADDDGWVWRWTLPDGAVTSARGDGEVVAATSDGARVLAIDERGVLRRWQIDGGVLREDGAVATGVPAKAAAFAEDGAAVIGGSDGRVVRVDGDVVTALGAHRVQVRAVAIASGGRVASAGDDGTLQVWDRDRHLELRGHRQRARHLAFAGDELLAADSAGDARRWTIAGVAPTVLTGHGAPVVQLALAGDELASADATGEVRRWRLADGTGERVGGHGARVTGLAFTRASSGARTVVSGGDDRAVAWWPAGPHDALASAPAGPRHLLASPVTALAADDRGVVLAAATEAGPIALFTGAGEPRGELPGHLDGTTAVALSPDGALLASGGEDRVVRVWTLARDAAGALVTAAAIAPPLELGPLDDDTRHVRFTPDGRWLLAAGDDGKLRAWPVEHGAIAPTAMRVLADHRTAVVALAIAADGAHVISEGRDHRRLISRIDSAAPPTSPAADAADATPAADAPASAADATVWLVIPGAPPRQALGRDDGAIVLRPAAPRTLADLRRRLAAASEPSSPHPSTSLDASDAGR